MAMSNLSVDTLATIVDDVNTKMASAQTKMIEVAAAEAELDPEADTAALDKVKRCNGENAIDSGCGQDVC